jgi:hypothetical protein
MLDVDLEVKVSYRYKEFSIGAARIDFMSSEIYDLDIVWSAFQYVKWMDNNPIQVAKMIQQAFDEAAADQGMHPELKTATLDLTKKLGEDFTFAVHGHHMKLEELLRPKIAYYDLGDYIFINEFLIADKIAGNDSIGFEKWFEALLSVMKRDLSKFARNLLVPEDVLPVFGHFRSEIEKVLKEKSHHWFKWEATGPTIWKGTTGRPSQTSLFQAYPFLKGKINPEIHGTIYGVKFEFLREGLLLNGGTMLFETDQQISSFVDKLVKDKKARDLVRAMKPLDVAKVVAVNLDLQPEPACKTALNLIKHAHDVHYEGMSSPGIESNKEFPVPPSRKRDKPRLLKFKTDESSVLARPQGKTVWGRPGPADIPRHHFPQDPRDEPEGWPFDDMTVASMKPGNKSRKRSLTTAKDNSDSRAWKQKGNPLNPDLKVRQPGGDGAGGGGIYRLTFQTKTGDMPGAGNKSWVAKGTKGWNSMPGAEFENPDADNDQPKDLKKKPPTGEAMGGGSRNVNPKSQNAGDEDEEIPSFMKDPPVGSSMPTTRFGGRTPAQPAGYRNWMKK